MRTCLKHCVAMHIWYFTYFYGDWLYTHIRHVYWYSTLYCNIMLMFCKWICLN